MTSPVASPIACSLAAGDLKRRLAWIADLNRDALRGFQRRGLVLELWFAPEAAGRVREMAERERACCGFLAFELTDEPEAIRLTIKVPEHARAAADMLFQHFVSSSEARAGCC